MKLLQKLLLSILALILITSLSIGIFSYYKASRSTNDLMMSKVDDQLQLRTDLIQEKMNNVKSTILQVSTDARVLEALKSQQDLIEVSDMFTTVKAQNKGLISLMSIVNKDNVIIATDSDNEGVIGVSLSERAYLKKAIESQSIVISDLIISKATGERVIAICEPIYSNGVYQGAVISTIDFVFISDVVAETKIATNGYGYMIDITGENSGAIVYHKDEELVENGQLLSNLSESLIPVTEQILTEETGQANYKYNGDKKVIQFQHIENWALIITANESDLKATSTEIRNITTITVLISVILSTIVSYFLVSKIITKPLSVLETAMEIAGNGDLNVSLDVSSKDEIGHLSRSFLKMINAFKDVLSTINSASEQVSAGSSQLSGSSMALSQGATEQASAIEELTATMAEISSKTEKNAEHANGAKGIVDSVKSGVETSNSQMNEMLSSMEDINQSSNNISKIIKVIDDIAFQTNILALNAAVEAARAGQHGKGFAVVAEEVRNLASQSADAAKETTLLIEGSIKKVKAGTVIANNTADSLKEIVEQIDITTNLVSDIAIASTEQSAGVNQVNQGIVQISAVVHTTSATAQETAAASEELSSQAAMLQSKVATFEI